MKGSLLLYRLPTKDETSETIVQNLYCPISYISVSFFAKYSIKTKFQTDINLGIRNISTEVWFWDSQIHPINI